MSSTILGVGSRVKHPAYGDGVVVGLEQIAYTVSFMIHGIKHVSKEYSDWEVIEALPSDNELTITQVEKALTKVLRRWSDVNELVDLGDKWDNGLMILKPGEEGLKSKEIPIETFFHKIVMLRDRLRVMEQRINSSKNLGEEEKVNLQQYLTRIYGSLTTFNVLFKYKDDHFKGEKTR